MNGLLPTLNMGNELTDIGAVAGNIIKDLLPWIGIAFAIFMGLIIITAIIEWTRGVSKGTGKEKGKLNILYIDKYIGQYISRNKYLKKL